MSRRPPTIKQTRYRYTVRHGCHDCLHAMIHWPDGGEPFRRCLLSTQLVTAAGFCGRWAKQKPQTKDTATT